MHAEQAGEGTGSTTGGGHRLVSPPASAPPAPRCGCSAAAAAGCPRSAGLQAGGNSSAQAAIMPVPGKSRAAGCVSAAATRHTRRRRRCPTCQEGATRRGMLPSQSGDGPDPAGRLGAPSGLQGSCMVRERQPGARRPLPQYANICAPAAGGGAARQARRAGRLGSQSSRHCCAVAGRRCGCCQPRGRTARCPGGARQGFL